MIHGEKDLIPPDAVRAVFERAGEPKKLVIYDCLHTDLYMREPWITQSADEAIAWFNRYLHNTRGQTPVTQDARSNKQVIRDFYEQTNKGNFDVYDELFAPDFVSYSSAAGGELRGPEAFKRRTSCTWHAFPGFPLDRRYDRRRERSGHGLRHRERHEYRRIFRSAADRQESPMDRDAIYRFNDEGKIDGRWQEFDGLGLFQQLGITPPTSGSERNHAFVEIATGARLHYEDARDSGDPLIALHGRFGTARIDLANVIDWLSQSYRVLGPSLRGYGESTPKPRDYPLDFYHRDARDVIAFMDALASSARTLLGYSDGGETALVAAGLAPDRFKSVAVWGAVGYFGADDPPGCPVELPGDWMNEETKRLHGITDPDPIVLQWVQRAQAHDRQRRRRQHEPRAQDHRARAAHAWRSGPAQPGGIRAALRRSNAERQIGHVQNRAQHPQRGLGGISARRRGVSEGRGSSVVDIGVTRYTPTALLFAVQ